MAKRKKKAVRVVLRKSSPLVKAVILVAVVLSTAALVALHANIDDASSQYEAMRMQAAALVENNETLDIRISDMGSVESVIQIAMEELGLVLPDTTIFDPID